MEGGRKVKACPGRCARGLGEFARGRSELPPLDWGARPSRTTLRFKETTQSFLTC